MSEIKHILFDCDGVLVDTEYVAAIKMTAMLNKLGVDISEDYYLKKLSGSTFSAIMKKYFADDLEPRFVKKTIDIVENEVAQEVTIIEGIDQVLNQLPNEKSVVSNSSVTTVKHALEMASIAHHFNNRIFSSEQVVSPKPAPDVYIHAIEQLALNPASIIVVEDSLMGASAALAADLRVIGFCGASHILPGHGENLQELGVDNVASDSVELLNMLNRLA